MESAKECELTDRQLECLRLCSIGKTSVDIGYILGITQKTVNDHLTSACSKLGTYKRIHACSIAVGLGLIEAPKRLPAVPGRIARRKVRKGDSF
jgi:DNA-binding CsgD family transcriptional regulator